ncbi:hypothetical protein DFH09DRAFT_974373 [Mycena vulgaris]|nr:hypothetical protein DFH09DRAFT_974373 [Mycena vulgaris]
MSDDSPQLTDALPPFSGALDPEGNIPPPDFILRAKDDDSGGLDVDFHVHREILKFVSVFFQDLFVVSGTPGGLQRDGKAVLSLDESSTVLYRLLCVAYPGCSLEHSALPAQSLDDLLPIHEAAQKYLFMGAKNQLENMLEAPAMLTAHAHRIFAIARDRKLPELARKAALATLNSTVCPQVLALPELGLLTAPELQKLYNFHHLCGEAAQKIVKEQAIDLDPFDTDYHPPTTDSYIIHNTITRDLVVWWTQGYPGPHSEACGGSRNVWCHEGVQCDAAPWFQNHSLWTAAELRAIPARLTVEREAVDVAPAERAMIRGCDYCLEGFERDLVSYATQLAALIEASNKRLAQDL